MRILILILFIPPSQAAAVIVYKAALEEAKTPTSKKDDLVLPASAAPLMGSSDPAKLYKELRDMFGGVPEFDAAIKEKETK